MSQPNRNKFLGGGRPVQIPVDVPLIGGGGPRGPMTEEQIKAQLDQQRRSFIVGMAARLYEGFIRVDDEENTLQSAADCSIDAATIFADALRVHFEDQDRGEDGDGREG